MDVPVIVVTGPIASGKSTVASFLASRGGEIIDADSVAHEALQDDDVMEIVNERFGDGVLDGDAELSRRRLGKLVFSDRARMEDLNDILRPVITSLIDEKVRELCGTARYIVLDAVLYFKYKFGFEARTVIVTEAPEDVRARRLIERDGMPESEASKRVEFQRYLYGDWRNADIVIDTDRPVDELRKEVENITEAILG